MNENNPYTINGRLDVSNDTPFSPRSDSIRRVKKKKKNTKVELPNPGTGPDTRIKMDQTSEELDEHDD